MSQNITVFADALKQYYLPAWNSLIGTSPSPLLSKVKKESITANEIISVAPKSMSGNFGMSYEGGDTPNAGPVLVQRFKSTAKDAYARIEISIKALKLATNAGAMMNALKTETDATYEAIKWNTGRMLHGDGSGKLTTVEALGAAGNTIKVGDTKNLKEGLMIDFYADGATVGTAPALAGRRILSIDRNNLTITIDGEATTVSAGFITVQKSFGREITGLNAIFDDSVTNVWGVDKASSPILVPIKVDAGGDITDSLILSTLRDSDRDRNGNVDMFLCGSKAFDAYSTYCRENNYRVESMSRELVGGYKAVTLQHGNRTIDIVYDEFVDDTKMLGVDTSALTLFQTGWDFAVDEGAPKFQLLPQKSVYSALLANYTELMCSNPGSFIEISNCA